jgi:hypothetical protein
MNAAVDGVMAAVAKFIADNPDAKYATVANYGTKERPRQWLTVKRFPPFIEKSGLAANESRLFLGRNDLKEPIVMDKPEDADTPTTTDVDWPTS